MMKLTPGSRWKSAVCDTEVVLVKPPKEGGELQCGGVAMVAHNEEKPAGLSLAADRAEGSLMGKRYGDEATSMEVLCTKAGKGTLAFSGRPLAIHEAKRLPSSD